VAGHLPARVRAHPQPPLPRTLRKDVGVAVQKQSGKAPLSLLFSPPHPNAQEWPQVAHPRLVCGPFSREKVVHNSKDSIKDGEVCCYRTKECRCALSFLFTSLLFIVFILFIFYNLLMYLLFILCFFYCEGTRASGRRKSWTAMG
jgi:hypothetical protein